MAAVVTSPARPAPESPAGWCDSCRSRWRRYCRTAAGWQTGGGAPAPPAPLAPCRRARSERRSAAPCRPGAPLESGLDRVIQLFQPVHELIRAHLAQETGTRFSSSISAESSSKPASRARMSSLRRTSWPERSSRGSGSVRPCCHASSTSSEKGRLPSYCWNSQERVPEKMPETPECDRRSGAASGCWTG